MLLLRCDESMLSLVVTYVLSESVDQSLSSESEGTSHMSGDTCSLAAELVAVALLVVPTAETSAVICWLLLPGWLLLTTSVPADRPDGFSAGTEMTEDATDEASDVDAADELPVEEADEADDEVDELMAPLSASDCELLESTMLVDRLRPRVLVLETSVEETESGTFCVCSTGSESG